jgi:Immune inhibitor A peptidase M6
VKRLVLALALAALTLAVPTAALAGNGNGNGNGPKGDVIDVGNDVGRKGKLKLHKQGATVAPAQSAAAIAAAAALDSPPIGTVKIWPLVNFISGAAQLTNFTLKAVGPHSEVWVANNLNYPTSGDCRNDGSRNVITQEQVEYLRTQFDENMYPKESAAFSVPPSRDGAKATLPGLVGLPADYYAGPGDKIVTLIANFRDENYFDITFPSYVAGYHSSGINAFVDRNVMSVDSFDWVHRTGANPPNSPSTVLCQNSPGQPFKYEGVFAHEYQHLLEFWASPGESTWANEGLSDYAITVTGYGATRKSIAEPGWEGHIQTFLGWRLLQTPANQIPQPLGGPENSLTAWDDQGNLETLSDYGAVWTFMEFLSGRYGAAFMTDLHNEDANGLPGLQAVLDKYLTGKTTQELIHEWAAMVAVDKSIDDGAKVHGSGREADYETPTLNSSIYWENPQAYSTPGAPPNGSDYVLLRDAAGNPLAAKDLSSLVFAAPKVHDLLPVTWRSVTDAPQHAGEPVLVSDPANNLDRRIFADVAVPAGSPTLTFDTFYNLEALWDYGIVQVSTDNGATWTSLANADTTTAHDPDARPTIVAQLPGLTGVTAAWRTETFDLSAYAGTSVLLAFRNMTDGGTLGQDENVAAGWWIDNVKVGSTTISDGSSVTGFRAEIAAPAVNGFTVQLVGLDSQNGKQVAVEQLPLADGFNGSVDRGTLRRLVGEQYARIGAIVTYDEPTEKIVRYARYALTANGISQPGG